MKQHFWLSLTLFAFAGCASQTPQQSARKSSKPRLAKRASPKTTGATQAATPPGTSTPTPSKAPLNGKTAKLLPAKAPKAAPLREGAAVLTYHRVASKGSAFTILTPGTFAAQMAYLHAHKYNVVPLQRIVACLRNKTPFPRAAVALTFDDGYKDDYTQVFPLLKKYQFPATLFVYTRYISDGSDALTWAQLREMQSSGLVDVQCHTLSHPNLSQAKKGEDKAAYLSRVNAEVEDSKRLLEEKIGRRVTMLAYPYGAYNPQVVQKTREAGYESAWTVDPAPVGAPVSPGNAMLRLPREIILRSDSMDAFKRKISARPLLLNACTPMQNGVTKNRKPVISAQLANDVLPNSVRVSVPSRGGARVFYDARTRTLTCRPNAPLRTGGCIVSVSARTKSGTYTQAAWSFAVEKPTS